MPRTSLVRVAPADLAARAVGTLRDVLDRPLAAGSQGRIERLVPEAGLSVTYISTPITTGPAYLGWLVAHRRASTDDRLKARDAMIRANITAVGPLVESAHGRFDPTALIDPTALEDVEGWAQVDYHRFWSEVIVRLVDRVVFANGWNLSTGCAIEFGVAAMSGIDMYNAQLQPLSQGSGLAALREAIPKLTAAGARNDVQADVVASLRG